MGITRSTPPIGHDPKLRFLVSLAAPPLPSCSQGHLFLISPHQHPQILIANFSWLRPGFKERIFNHEK